MRKLLLAAVAFTMLATYAQAAERRIALVVGNANYQTGALPTPANDAGLVAQTLQAAGFDVTGARDLDQDSLRHAFRDFVDKAAASGSDTVALIYLSGYGLQLEGENYFAPIDARINTAANVPAEALRLSDFARSLAGLGLKATIVVLDMARANPFAQSGPPLSGGLALVDADTGQLIAFNAAPGTIAPDEAGPYSAYAQALAETIREGGVALEDVFARVRLRVNQTTNGAQIPWDVSKLQAPLYLFERGPDAPQPQVSADQTASIRTRPIRSFPANDAYMAALERDKLEGYESFLSAYPNDPMAPRVHAIAAARREAVTWRRSRNVDTPQAYWSYLERYPRGAHSADARRRLSRLSAAYEPPASFEAVAFDVPPPPPEEIVYVERPVLVFDDPEFDFAPPPPPPIFFLPPPPVYFVDLPPPPPPLSAFFLPFPEYRPVPVWVLPPPQIEPPPNNIIFNNIHNQVVINNATNVVTITDPQGQARTLTPAAAAAAAAPAPARPGGSPPGLPPSPGLKAGIATTGIAAGAAAAAVAPSLPPTLARKAAVTPNPQPVAPARPLAPGGILGVKATTPQSPAPGAQPAAAAKTPNGKAGLQPPPLNGKPPPTGLSPVAPSPPAATGTSAPAGGQLTSKPNDKAIGQPLPGAGGGQPLPPLNGKRPSIGNPPATTALPPTGTQPGGGPLAPKSNGKEIGHAAPGAGGGQPLPPLNDKLPTVSNPPGTTGLPPTGTQPAGGPLTPKTNGKAIGQPLPGVGGGQPLPPLNGKAPSGGNPPATTALPPSGTPPADGKPASSPAAKLPPPAAAKLPAATPPALTPAPAPFPAAKQLALPPAAHAAPPVDRAPPPASVYRAPPPAPVYRAPPPAPNDRGPPPARVDRTPPLQPVYRAPPPQPVYRAPPPAPVDRGPPPARVDRAPPPAAARSEPKGCILPNGQPCR